jgi:transcriptional regulator of acetoin/glycerol metabolism
VVTLYATTIENCLLRAQSGEHLVVHLQTSPSLLGTPMEGLAGLDARGRIAWVNPMGARLLGLSQGERGHTAQAVFGVDAAQLTRLTRAQGAQLHRLPNGLNVWTVVRLQASDGASRLHALGALAIAPGAGSSAPPGAPPSAATVATPAGAATLRDLDRSLIARTVQACAGNVSQAARTLGVSRGLVYRHLKRSGTS